MDGAEAATPGRMPATLKRRAEFLACARGRKAAMPGMIVQARETCGAEARIGYTCSKKVGNAVTRNRAKRRLRAAARDVMPGRARPGWDYVLIGRAGATVSRPFAALTADLAGAVERLHGPRR